jgi:hypothetical protein
MSLLKVCLLVFLALLLGCFGNLAAQDFMSQMGDCTVAQPGDSFWRIANYHLSPRQWEVLWAKNPTTPDGKARRFFKKPETGFSYVHLGVNEVICGLKEAGVVPTIATDTEMAKMGLLRKVTETKEVTPMWLWWLLAFFVALVIFTAFRQWLMGRDPTRVGAGRVVENGINTPSEAAQHFRTQAAQELGDTAGVLPDMVRIISMIRGRGFGPVQVTDRVRALFRRILNGEVVWQATVQAPDRAPQIRYTLAGCGNDLRWGGGMTSEPEFRFVADTDVTDEIQREPVTQPNPVQQHTAAPFNIEPTFIPQPAPTPAQPEPAPQPEPVPVQPEPAPAPIPVVNNKGEAVRTTDAPATTAPQPVAAPQKKGRKLRFSIDKDGDIYSKMNGFKNLSIEEDEEGSLIIRADR